MENGKGLSLEAIAFGQIFGAYKDLQIVLDVQTAHDLALQRNDMVDVMDDAGLSGDASALGIDSGDNGVISPCRRCL